MSIEIIQSELKRLQEDDRDFVKDFMPKFFELKDNSWSFALLNPNSSTFLQITTSKDEDALTKIIKWLETYLDNRRKTVVEIDGNSFVIEPVKNKANEEKAKINFYILRNGKTLFHSNAFERYFIFYWYINWFDFIFEETDFDIPYFNQDITQIKSDRLGLYCLEYSGVRKPLDFNAWAHTGSRWKDADNLRRAKWCLLAAKTKRVLHNGRFEYSVSGNKILSNNEIESYIANMDKIIELAKKSAASFEIGYISYGNEDYAGRKHDSYFWSGIFSATIELCGMKDIEVELGADGYEYETEQEVYAEAIASIMFCSRGLDSALW